MPDTINPNQQSDARDNPIGGGDTPAGGSPKDDIACGGEPKGDGSGKQHKRFSFKIAAELILATVIAVATVINVCVAYRQWSAMIDNNDISRKSLIEVQRAFVTPNGMNFELKKEGGGISVWRVVANVVNSGNTPTYNAKYRSAMGANMPIKDPGRAMFPLDGGMLDPEDGFIGNNNQLYKPLDTRLGRFLLGPHVIIPIFDALLPDEQMRRTLTIVGAYIEYDDVVAKGHHRTKFCYVISAINDDTITPAYAPCEYWNCADDECKEDKKEYREAVTKWFRRRGKEVPSDFFGFVPPE
jgi:hypothetical protein